MIGVYVMPDSHIRIYEDNQAYTAIVIKDYNSNLKYLVEKHRISMTSI